MIKIIKTYKYQKVEILATELELPEVPLYCFQTGIRRAIRIIPVFTTWNKEQGKKEELFSLDVTCVYGSFEDKIEHFDISIHGSALEGMISNDKDSYNIGRMLLRKDYNIRTKEQFEEDLQAVINKILNPLS